MGGDLGGDFMLEGFTKIPVLSGSSFMSVTSNGINFNGNVVFHLQRTKFVVFFLSANCQIKCNVYFRLEFGVWNLKCNCKLLFSKPEL